MSLIFDNPQEKKRIVKVLISYRKAWAISTDKNQAIKNYGMLIATTVAADTGMQKTFRKNTETYEDARTGQQP
jgi:hypothetical protein